jgi:hypothetical protein
MDPYRALAIAFDRPPRRGPRRNRPRRPGDGPRSRGRVGFER